MTGPVPTTTGYLDVEAFVTYWLGAVLGYTQVQHEQPRNLRTVATEAPLIIVERFGGSDPTITIDVARLDVDVYAGTRDAARSHAYTIWQGMRTQLPRYQYGGAVVHRVDTISAPTHASYDSAVQVRRFTASYQLRIHKFTGV